MAWGDILIRDIILLTLESPFPNTCSLKLFRYLGKYALFGLVHASLAYI